MRRPIADDSGIRHPASGIRPSRITDSQEGPVRRVYPPTHTPPDPQPPAFRPARSPAPRNWTGPALMVVAVSAGACGVLCALALVLHAAGAAAGAMAALPTGGILTGLAAQFLRKRS
ncbi:hypothetical protein AB0I68_26860 [Streptomyces sp. NPDC050448]|uniref:hypothetical protein n=1 Tax=Streptomyces sp. NPDC050448 TaxID=3155404 RepID=UPI003414C7B7